MATTYNNLYLEIRRMFKAASLGSASLEARELVCFAAGKKREEFFRDLSLYASDEVEARVQELAARRLSGEPVAYIIGEWEFYGLTLDITPQVLIPRMDTEVLAEQAIAAARAVPHVCRVLDLCSGSGCIGLAVAANVPESQVILADVSEEALAVCEKNICRCGLLERVSTRSIDVRLPASPELGKFDVLTCNPPYIPSGDIADLDISVRDYEPHLALDGGEDGLDFYRWIASQWRGGLRSGGRLLLEVGIGQAPEVEMFLSRSGFEKIESFQDTQGIWRVVSGTVPG